MLLFILGKFFVFDKSVDKNKLDQFEPLRNLGFYFSDYQYLSIFVQGKMNSYTFP